MNKPEQGPEQIWQALKQQAAMLERRHLAELFAERPGRSAAFSLRLPGLYLNYSRSRVNAEALRLLALAAEMRLPDKIGALFGGAPVNHSENRPALHTLLRAAGDDEDVSIGGQSGRRLVDAQKQKMYRLCRRLRAGELTGAGGAPITRLINIGIGGSDLGPRLALEALASKQTAGLDVDFIANIDPAERRAALHKAEPASTLFVVVSKSFTTLETLTNAKAAKAWLRRHGCSDIARHFIGVSENAAAVAEFGIAPDHYLKIWPWVGGRYSVWSCAGFVIAAALGEEGFESLLAGAQAMDKHFRSCEPAANMPVILGLLGVWYSSILGLPAHAVVPYAQRLRLLPDYLGQLAMESNGKSVTQDGHPCPYLTAPVLWGGVGSTAQHAFFQLLHQGSARTSLDLIAVVNGDDAHDREKDACDEGEAHALLFANCIAQGEALMRGQAKDQTKDKAGLEQAYRHFPGNRPSVTLLLKELSPYTLGMLLALYEHKTFVEAALWDINPFDQWGVQLGKTMAKQVAASLRPNAKPAGLDATSRALLDFYREEKYPQ